MRFNTAKYVQRVKYEANVQ